MSINCSFGEKNEESEEEEKEYDINALAQMKDKELTIDDINYDTENAQIFNQVTTKEIDMGDEENKLEYYQSQLIQEKINLALSTIITNINIHINIYKKSFFNKMKLILDKKYSNLITIQLLYMNIKLKFENLLFLTEFIKYKKIQKAFYNIKNYAFIIKKQIQEEQNIKKEKENKINVLSNKISSLNNNINETNKRINGLDNIQKKLNGENKDLKNKISQMNEKVNQLIKYGNNLKESITNKKNINNINNNNNINGKNNENRIQNLKNMIEQKEKEKEREMKDIDKFCENMDLVLNQYESMSEAILSNCNINITK